MKLYKSFLVRCWQIRDERRGERSLFDIEHIQTGERLRTTSLGEAQSWMTDARRAEARDAEGGNEECLPPG